MKRSNLKENHATSQKKQKHSSSEEPSSSLVSDQVKNKKNTGVGREREDGVEEVMEIKNIPPKTKKKQPPQKLYSKSNRLFKKDESSSDESSSSESSSSSSDSDSGDENSIVQKKPAARLFRKQELPTEMAMSVLERDEAFKLMHCVRNEMELLQPQTPQQVYLINGLMNTTKKFQFKKSIDVPFLALKHNETDDNDCWWDFKPLFPFLCSPCAEKFTKAAQLGLFKVFDITKPISYTVNINGLATSFEDVYESSVNAYRYYRTYKQEKPKLTFNQVVIYMKIVFLDAKLEQKVFEVKPHHTIQVNNFRVTDNSGKLIPTVQSCSFSRIIQPSLFMEHLKSGKIYGVKVRMQAYCPDLKEGDEYKGKLNISWDDDSEMSIVMTN
ncbi:hypothetical protein C9374_010055 [Naegleria lovaniensis]|uniref:Uncharacterized protein n=1 Tax=Naegleria lovaniensis TaxID=51637 RepID=A0AA88KGN1_NAELO|nr:uncharacterized protein C9374_010055 [Naegleria lovaniensis]KAG2375051.1 hypothetical protein C9374_010055 [Naegleria lovaniensis]